MGTKICNVRKLHNHQYIKLEIIKVTSILKNIKVSKSRKTSEIIKEGER